MALSDLADARQQALSGMAEFLPSWIEQLQAACDEQYGFGLQARRLHAEALELHRGTDGLAERARIRSPHQADACWDWIDALIRAGRSDDAERAACEALEMLGQEGFVRARIAERLARLAAARSDAATVLMAQREAWRAAPSWDRLTRLADAAIAIHSFDATFADEARHATSGGGPLEQETALAAAVLLLAGRVDDAVALASGAGSVGWSRGTHPGPAADRSGTVASGRTAPARTVAFPRR